MEISIKSCNSKQAETSPEIFSSECQLSDTTEDLINNYNLKFLVEDKSVESLAIAIESEGVKEFLENIQQQIEDTDSSVDSIVSELRRKLFQISKENFVSRQMFSKRNKNLRYKPSPWFDDDCKDMKKSLNRAQKCFKDALKKHAVSATSNEAQNAYFSLRREYKKLLRAKRSHFLATEKNKLWELKNAEPASFWKKLSSKPRSVCETLVTMN